MIILSVFFIFLDFGIFASAIGFDAQNSDAEARLRYKLPKSMRMEYADGVPRSDGEMTTPTSPNRDPPVVTAHPHRKKKDEFIRYEKILLRPHYDFLLF